MWIKCQPIYGQQHVLNTEHIIDIWNVSNTSTEYEIQASTTDCGVKTLGQYPHAQMLIVMDMLFDALESKEKVFEMPKARSDGFERRVDL